MSHAEITIASPAGGEAPLDPSSVEASKDDKTSQDFLKNKEDLWKKTEKLSSFIGKAKDFDALFYVGGHGRKLVFVSFVFTWVCLVLKYSLLGWINQVSKYRTFVAKNAGIAMFDLANDKTSHQLIREFAEEGLVVSAVCHGPAALINAKLSDGSYLVANSPVTGFSNAEEDQVGLSQYMPFMLEDELNKNSGGKFEKAAKPWEVKVVVAKGGKLITGQNPASAAGVGEAILKSISKK